MNLKSLSDASLVSQTKSYVKREREMTLQVLHHLREIEARRLFAAEGFSSLFDYATKELGYDSASAMRRIDAMRLLKEIPEIEERIQEGALGLTNVARAQSFFSKEDVSLERKKEILTQLEGLSTRETEKTLLSLSDQPEAHLKEKVKVVTPQLSEVKIYLTDEQMEKLERLKGLLAHSHPEMSLAELVSYLSDLGLKKLDPSQKEGRGGSAQNESVRQASVSTTRFVWKRDQGQCAWLHPQTGRRCTSRYRLQRDHRIPWAKGGRTTRENLRLLCFHHNQLEAEREFGVRIS